MRLILYISSMFILVSTLIGCGSNVAYMELDDAPAGFGELRPELSLYYDSLQIDVVNRTGRNLHLEGWLCTLEHDLDSIVTNGQVLWAGVSRVDNRNLRIDTNLTPHDRLTRRIHLSDVCLPGYYEYGVIVAVCQDLVEWDEEWQIHPKNSRFISSSEPFIFERSDVKKHYYEWPTE